MTPNALATQLFSTYELYRANYLRPSNCRHKEITDEMRDLVARSDNLLTMRELGKSLEGRSIHMISLGRGDKKILLWSSHMLNLSLVCCCISKAAYAGKLLMRSR